MDGVASAAWRKSSFSGNSGNCTEVATAPGVVLVRDTQQAGRGPVLRITAKAWKKFTDDIK